MAGDEEPVTVLLDVHALARSAVVGLQLVQVLEVGWCRQPEHDVLEAVDRGRTGETIAEDDVLLGAVDVAGDRRLDRPHEGTPHRPIVPRRPRSVASALPDRGRHGDAPTARMALGSGHRGGRDGRQTVRDATLLPDGARAGGVLMHKDLRTAWAPAWREATVRRCSSCKAFSRAASTWARCARGWSASAIARASRRPAGTPTATTSPPIASWPSWRACPAAPGGVSISWATTWAASSSAPSRRARRTWSPRSPRWPRRSAGCASTRACVSPTSPHAPSCIDGAARCSPSA